MTPAIIMLSDDVWRMALRLTRAIAAAAATELIHTTALWRGRADGSGAVMPEAYHPNMER